MGRRRQVGKKSFRFRLSTLCKLDCKWSSRKLHHHKPFPQPDQPTGQPTQMLPAFIFSPNALRSLTAYQPNRRKEVCHLRVAHSPLNCICMRLRECGTLRNFAVSQPLPHIPERTAHPALPLGRIFIVHLNDEARSRSSLSERFGRRREASYNFCRDISGEPRKQADQSRNFLPGLFKGGRPQWIRYI